MRLTLRPCGLLLAFVLTCILAGCASVGPDYVRPEVAAPAVFKEAAGWKTAEPMDDVPRGNWWEVYRDPVLNGLVMQVQVSNQNVKVADAQYRQALTLIDQARAQYFPIIGADVSTTRSRDSLSSQAGSARSNTASGAPLGSASGTPSGGAIGASTPTSTTNRLLTTDRAALSASWELDVWGRIRRTVESNQAAAQASAGDLAAALLSEQAALVQSYLELRVTDAQIDLLEQSIEAYRRALDITNNRYKAGVAQRSDVTQAQVQLESTRAQALDLGVQRAQFEHAIAILMGRAPADFAIERTNSLPAVPNMPLTLPATLLERRPDIAAAERRAASANAQIGVARAALFPSLTLGASGGYEGSSFAHLFSLPQRFWTLGPELAATLFDAGERRARQAQAAAAYDENVASYRQTVLTAFQDVEDNLAALRILVQESAVQLAAATAAAETLRITQNQYEAGLVDYLNVVAAQNALLTAERTSRDIAGRRLTASVGLLRALGGDWRASSINHLADASLHARP